MIPRIFTIGRSAVIVMAGLMASQDLFMLKTSISYAAGPRYLSDDAGSEGKDLEMCDSIVDGR